MSMGSAAARSATITAPFLAALFVACAALAPAARSTTIAVVDAAGVRTIDAAGHPVATVADQIDALSVAYDGSGRLLATVSGASESSCDVVDPATGQTVAEGETVIASTDRGAGVCEIATDPAGGLLFGASNLTAGSTATYRLAADGSVTWATGGYAASAALDGTVVSVMHRYWSAGGSYEQPWITPPSGRARALARAPSRTSRSWQAYTSVAITRDAARVAATALIGTRSARAELLVGAASQRLSRVRWRPAAPRVFAGVQWLPDGSGLIVGLARSSSARTFDLYRVDADGRHRSRIASGLRTFAVGVS